MQLSDHGPQCSKSHHTEQNHPELTQSRKIVVAIWLILMRIIVNPYGVPGIWHYNNEGCYECNPENVLLRLSSRSLFALVLLVAL